MSIRCAHIVAVTPHRAGIYETAREIVIGERSQGIDARIVDCGNKCEAGLVNKKRKELEPYFAHLGVARNAGIEGAINYLKTTEAFNVECVKKGTEDRGIIIEDNEWVINEADIIVGHSGFHNEIQNLNKPYIMCAHGRPKSSFLLEYYKEYSVYASYVNMNHDKRILKFITFWKEYIPNIAMLVNPEKIEYVPPCVDTNFFNPEGEKFDFPDNKKFNIIIVDVWRKDIDPYHVVHCCHWFCKKHPEAQFHMFGCKPPDDMGPWKILLGKCQKEGTLGIVTGMIKEIDKVYRSADMMATPHTIATRTVRESLASGLPLVAEEGNPYTNYHAPLYNYDRFIGEMERCYKSIQLDKQSTSMKMRKSAEKHFSMENTGKAMKKIIENTLEEWKSVDLTPEQVLHEAVVM